MKLHKILYILLKYVFLNLITIACVLFGEYNLLIRGDNVHFLADPLSLGTFIFIIIFSLHEIIGLITFLVFNIKGKIAINNGEKVNYDFRKISLIKGILYYSIFIIAIMTFIYLGVESDVNILKVIIILAFLLVISNYIINFIKNMKYKNNYIIVSGAYLALLLAIFFISTNMIFNNAFIKDYKYNDETISKAYDLRLEDFNNIKGEDSPVFRIEKTPIASHLFYIESVEEDYLIYDVFESKYKWPIKYNFYKLMKFSDEIDAKYIEKKVELSKEIKVYKNNKENKYIIISQNKMVEISIMDNVSEEGLINIVYEKIFK